MTTSRRDFLRLYEAGILPLGVAAAGTLHSGRAAAYEGLLDPASDAQKVLDAAAFGVKADGIQDDTSAWQDLLGEAQASRSPIRFEAGRYFGRSKIREGMLKWTFHNDLALPFPGPDGPVLLTSGNPVFVAAGKDDAPLLQIHNDPRPAPSGGGNRFVTGGYVGALSFEDQMGDAVNRHGISIFGISLMHFGIMRAVNGLGGDVIHVEAMGGPTTADAWHVAGCFFEGVLAKGIRGWAFNCAAVSQVFTHNRIGFLGAYQSKGAFRGAGSKSVIDRVSAYDCSEWALDLSTDIGLVQGFEVGQVEADSNRNSLRVRGVNNLKIGMFRHIYRQVGQEVWPLNAAVFGDEGMGRQARDVEANFFFRFSDVPEQAPKPKLFDFTNDPNNSNIKIENRLSVLDYAPDDESFLQGINPVAKDFLIIRDGQPILDNRRNNRLIVRSKAGKASVLYGTHLVLDSIELDEAKAWDAEAHAWICPATAVYRVHAQLEYVAAPSALVRIGLFLNDSSVPFREMRTVAPEISEISQSYSVDAVHRLARGDRVHLSFCEESGKPLSAGSVGLINANFLEIYPV